MKKFLFSLLLTMFTMAAFADQTSILYLKNGSVIKGEILEAVPNGDIKIQTIDGSIFVYSADQVERIAKNEDASRIKINKPGYQFSTAKGLDLYIEAGPDFCVDNNGGTMLNAQVEIGKRINKSLFLGVGGGVMTTDGYTMFPLMGGGRIFMPLETNKVLPFLSVRGGYAFAEHGFPCVEVMPGFQYKLSKNVDFTFGVGYVGSFGDNSSNSVGVRVGFGFHGSTEPKLDVVKQPKKPSDPPRDKGLQVEIGGVMTRMNLDGLKTSYGPALSLLYKVNPYLSVGIGGRMQFNRNLAYYEDEHNSQELPAIVYFGDYRNESDGCTSYEIFFKGKSRILGDRRFSPIIGLEVGVTKINWDGRTLSDRGDVYDKEHNNNVHWSFGGYLDSKMALFFAPTAGFSLRIGSNSYLDANISYGIMGATTKLTVYEDRCENVVVEKYKAPKMKGLQIGLSFTHTLNILSGK